MTRGPVGPEWSTTARNREVTDELLVQARKVLDGMQLWQETIGVACRIYNFQTHAQAAEWFATVPKVDPGTRSGREQWLRGQRAIATRKPKPGPIPRDRALQIAMDALAKTDPQPQPKNTTKEQAA